MATGAVTPVRRPSRAPPVPLATTAVHQWKKDLFKYTLRDDVGGVRSILNLIEKSGKRPSDLDLCDSKYKTTVLHVALRNRCNKVAKYLIDHHNNADLLVAKCTGIISPRDALYVITRNLQVVCCIDSDGQIVKGEVGTIVDVIRGDTDDRSSQNIVVIWEFGTKKTYVCTDESLRVLDNSRLGVTHALMCDGCFREEFAGFRWRCSKCYNYELCNGCYMSDKHNTEHEFYRIDMPGCKGVRVSARASVVADRRIAFAKPRVTHQGIPRVLGLYGVNQAAASMLDFRLPDTPGRISNNLDDLTDLKNVVVAVDITLLSTVYKLNYDTTSNSSFLTANKSPVEVVRNTRASMFTYRDASTDDECSYVNTTYSISATCYADHLPKLSEYGSYDPARERQETEDDDYESAATLHITGCSTGVTEQNDAENDVKYFCKIIVQDLTLTNDEDCFSITCLTILAAFGDTGMAKYLLHKISDRENFLNYHDPSTYHSIHIAAANGHTSFVEMLVDDGVDVNFRGRHNYTPIMYAIRGKHLDTVEMLIQREANLTAASKRGKTALHVAASDGSYELVRMLVGGADVKQINQVVNTRHKSTMLFVASQSGNIDIVDYLLTKNADVKARSASGSTALHEAAWNGHTDVVVLLLTKGKAKVDEVDDNGDTALLLAANQKRLNVMQVLVENGSSIDHVNKDRNSIWNYVLEGDDQLLTETIQLYRKSKKLNTKVGLKFETDANPLLVATRARKLDKLSLLLDLGVYIHSVDKEGNTFYHVAASEGYLGPVERFEKQLRLGTTNKYGQTALHLAAVHKHIEVVTLLVRKSQRDNRSHYTKALLLTAAAFGDLVVIKSVSEAIEQIGKSLPLEEPDFQGNTALHLAARRGDMDMMRRLVSLHFDPEVRNKAGLMPFHEAMQSGKEIDVAQLLELFSRRPGVKFNVDAKSHTSWVGDKSNKNECREQIEDETALHMSTRRGDWHTVEQLIRAGADLQEKNSLGNTALHVLVEGSTRDPAMACKYVEVIKVFVQLSAKWYIRKTSDESTEARAAQRVAVMNMKASSNRTSPNAASPKEKDVLPFLHKWLQKWGRRKLSAEDQTRKALLHLLWEIENMDGKSVIAMAVSMGAVTVIDSLLDMPRVFKFTEKSPNYLYDITYLTPDTIEPPTKQESDSEAAVRLNRKRSDVEMNRQTNVHLRQSCLELIMEFVDNGDTSDDILITAAKMLDTNPLRILVDNYRRGYQCIFRILTLIHVAHMLCFTYFTLPDRNRAILRNDSIVTLKSIRCSPTNMTTGFGVFLVWPACIVVGLAMIWFYGMATRPTPRVRPSTVSKMCSLHKLVLQFAANNLPLLAVVAFSLLTVAWYVLRLCGSDERVYWQVSASVFILGWTMTLYFATSTQDLIFSTMFEKIAFRDISRFVFMYAFILVGFGLAFHSLFQLSPRLAAEYRSPAETLIATFSLMVGAHSMLENDFQSKFESDGGNLLVVYVVYVLYVITATIVMLNMLIAMMTNSYENCKQNASIIWRVSSLRLALRIIRLRQSLACFKGKPWSVSPYSIKYEKSQRWMLKVPIHMNDDDSSDRSEKLDAIFGSIQRLELKLSADKNADKEIN